VTPHHFLYQGFFSRLGPGSVGVDIPNPNGDQGERRNGQLRDSPTS
jgi:hypothetical protein